MGASKLYTNKDLDKFNKNHLRDKLYKSKLNSIIIYSETSNTMDLLLNQYKNIIGEIALDNGLLWSSSALCNMARTESTIADLDYTLVKEIINTLCQEGVLLKKGAISGSGKVYSFVLHQAKVDEFSAIISYLLATINSKSEVYVSEIQKQLNNVKGSYFWAKIIIDHIEWLGFGRHAADDMIKGFHKELII